MDSSQKEKDCLLSKLHEEYLKNGKVSIPSHLLPPERGYHILEWTKELFKYYEIVGVSGRAMDDLPPIALSKQKDLDLTLQHIHKFIIGDRNLLPLQIKKDIIYEIVNSMDAVDAWKRIKPILLTQLRDVEKDEVIDELSWRFNPIVEIIWLLTWYFLELEEISPPKGTVLFCKDFPYYIWISDGRACSYTFARR